MRETRDIATELTRARADEKPTVSLSREYAKVGYGNVNQRVGDNESRRHATTATTTKVVS